MEVMWACDSNNQVGGGMDEALILGVCIEFQEVIPGSISSNERINEPSSLESDKRNSVVYYRG